MGHITDNASRGHYSRGHITNAYSGATGLPVLPSTGSPVAWWRGDLDASPSLWGDQIGSADWVQGTEANQGSFVNSGFGTPALRFNGTSDYMSTADAAALALANGNDKAWTVIFAAITNTDASSKIAFSWADISATDVYHFNDTVSGNVRSRRRDGVSNILQSGAGTYDTNSVVVYRYTGTTIAIYVNGVTLLAPSTMDTGAVTFDQMTLGARISAGSPTGFFSGDIADMAAYGTALSNADLNAISIGYFGAVHGISVAQVS